jgi:hypothetical protein
MKENSKIYFKISGVTLQGIVESVFESLLKASKKTICEFLKEASEIIINIFKITIIFILLNTTNT